MRVGLVCPYSFDVHGGVQNHVLALADHLVASGHHVGVLAPGDPDRAAAGPLPPFVTTTGRTIAMPYNGSIARVSFGPLVAARVRRWLAEGGFDLLHIHEPATPSVSVLALWAARTPVVATFHTAQERSRTLETSAATVLRAGLAKISGHIAVSDEARATMGRYLAAAPVVIPNGVRTADFAAAGARVGATTRRPPTLVFVGRLDEPRKGLPVLLDALPAVLRQHPGTRLVVVGAGDARAALSGLEPALVQHVDVVGPVDDHAKARLVADADLLVAPNTHGESFGIVLVEAMAAGTPVVAGDLPAFRRVLAGGALGALCAQGDPRRLAHAVSGLLADPARRSTLARRARTAASAYDWSVLTPRVLEVYGSVLAGSHEVVAG